jgi:hypothetical protein
MKREISNNFKNIYKGKRLLAVQLNGFSHKVFFDGGSGSDPVQVEEYSAYTRMERQTKEVEQLLSSYSHYNYKRAPKELIYVSPEKR